MPAAAPVPSLRTLALPAEVDPLAIVGLVAATWCYLAGVRHLARRGRRWPAGRTATFLAGVAVVAVATNTGLARYDTVLFSAHVAQHVLLGMVGPVLLALGAPLTLALQSAPTGARRRLRLVLAHRATAVVTHPVMTLVLFGGTLFALYFTPVYEVSLRHGVVHAAVHLHLLLAGLVFAVVVVGVDAVRHRLPPAARLGLVGLTIPFHAFLGVALLSSDTVLAGDWYRAVGRTWGPTLLADQRTGAGILWATGELFGVVLALVVVAQWMAEAHREGRRHDRLTAPELVAR